MIGKNYFLLIRHAHAHPHAHVSMVENALKIYISLGIKCNWISNVCFLFMIKVLMHKMLKFKLGHCASLILHASY